MANFDISYVLYALVIAAIVIVLVYFSKVEEDEPPKSKGKRVLQIENKNDPQPEQLKQRLNEQIENHDREYQQTLIQIREAEKNRKIAYGRQIENLSAVKAQLMNARNTFMKEKKKL